MAIPVLITDQYQFKDIKIVIDGKPIRGIRGVTLKKSMEKEALYGQGSKPMAIQTGNVSYEGEVKVLQSELNVIQSVAGVDILEMGYFQMVVVFAKVLGGKIETYTIVNAQFTEYEVSMEQGDKNAEITLPFIALDLLKN